LLTSLFGSARGGGLAPQKARDGTWETRDKGPLKAGRPVDRWFVVVFAVSSRLGTSNLARDIDAVTQDDNTGRDGFSLRDVQGAIMSFTRACATWGIRFSVTQPSILHVGSTMEVERAIKDGAKRAGFGPGNLPQFVVTLVSLVTLSSTALPLCLTVS
jgi:hypothetical protein